jgi:hypothetical protein
VPGLLGFPHSFVPCWKSTHTQRQICHQLCKVVSQLRRELSQHNQPRVATTQVKRSETRAVSSMCDLMPLMGERIVVYRTQATRQGCSAGG